MSIVVEHEKRRNEILEKALQVFVEEGYTDTTYQKIADRCGITRTILYIYFKNKREIFLYSIKRFTEALETELKAIIARNNCSNREKLESVTQMIIETCGANAKLLQIIVEYLQHLAKAGVDTAERVRRRIIRLRHLLAGIIIAGQKSGEFEQHLQIKAAIDFFYILIESIVVRVALLQASNLSEVKNLSNTFIAMLCKNRA